MMEIHTKSFQTSEGPLEGVHVSWPGFGILLVTGSKGFLACPAFDVDVCERYGAAAAIVESSPDNPIGTLERFPNRNLTKVNPKTAALGLKEGMAVTDAFSLIA
jgi:uncharacterized protein YunC (DUF1805 family)